VGELSEKVTHFTPTFSFQERGPALVSDLMDHPETA